MSENKTREDIISEHSPHGEYNHYYHEHAILEMLTEFADQEKRSKAIAFAEWMGKNRVVCTSLVLQTWTIPPKSDDEYTTSELFDQFINSL